VPTVTRVAWTQLARPALSVAGTEIDEETALLRLGGSTRPLLAGDEDPVTRWKTLVDERRPLYDAVATTQVAASHGPPSTVVNRIVDVLTGLQRAEEYARYQDMPEHEDTDDRPPRGRQEN